MCEMRDENQARRAGWEIDLLLSQMSAQLASSNNLCYPTLPVCGTLALLIASGIREVIRQHGAHLHVAIQHFQVAKKPVQ